MANKTPLKSGNAPLKLTNEQFLTAISKLTPEFGQTLAKLGRDVFNEKGFIALQNLPGTGDNVTRFFEAALLVGRQTVVHPKYKDVLAKIGLIERVNMAGGGYDQETRLRRIKNVNPAWLGSDGTGLKNGDSVDPFKVRKPELDQAYFGINFNYQNWFTLQDFDLKMAWINPENGIQNVVSAAYEMVDLDRLDVEFTKAFEVLNGAINNTTYPLKDTQKLVLDSWTGSGTDTEYRALIQEVKNVVEVMDAMTSVDFYNAGGYPNSCATEDMVLMVRLGMKSKIEDVMAYAFGPDYLQFPIKVHSVANFGGIEHYAADDTSHTTKLVPVTDADGVYTGYWSADGTTTGQIADAETVEVDPNSDVLAVIAEKGVIKELIKNEVRFRNIFNPRGEYENTFINQPDNGINYNHFKNLITISKPSA